MVASPILYTGGHAARKGTLERPPGDNARAARGDSPGGCVATWSTPAKSVSLIRFSPRQGNHLTIPGELRAGEYCPRLRFQQVGIGVAGADVGDDEPPSPGLHRDLGRFGDGGMALGGRLLGHG